VFDTLEIQIYILYVYYYDMYVVLKYMYIIFTEEVPMGGGDVLLVEGCCFPLEETDTILQKPHSSWQLLLHATNTVFLEEMMAFL